MQACGMPTEEKRQQEPDRGHRDVSHYDHVIHSGFAIGKQWRKYQHRIGTVGKQRRCDYDNGEFYRGPVNRCILAAAKLSN